MMRALPLDSWPASDRAALAIACKPRVKWKPGGTAARLRPSSIDNLVRRYGYYLTWLSGNGLLDAAGSYTTLVTPDRVAAYIDYARDIWSSVTVHNAVSNLAVMRRYLAPDADFAWLNEFALDVKAEAKAKYDRPCVTAEQLLKLGIQLFDRAAQDSSLDPRVAAKGMRDGLIFALLVNSAARANSFLQFELGRSVTYDDGCWWIKLDRHQTKSGKPLEIPVFDFAASRLETYLLRARPVFLASCDTPDHQLSTFPASQLHTDEIPRTRVPELGTVHKNARHTSSSLTDRLWVSYYGRPLNYLGLHQITTSRGQEGLGIHVTPHMCRNAVATTAAWKGAKHPHLGSTLLQHSSQAMTDHYDRSAAFQASISYGQMLRNRKS